MQSEKTVMFLSMWVLNSMLFVIFDQLLGTNLVLGNDRVIGPMAAIFSGLILTLALYTVEPLVKKGGFKIKDQRIMAVFYFIANFVGIWAIKRLERVTGVGISNTMYVGIVAVVAMLTQWGVVKYLVPQLVGKGKKGK